jgi:crotonobetainyl-CoA:carnitine CoA-transferase CaiB-like acyl-CoA transferase
MLQAGPAPVHTPSNASALGTLRVLDLTDSIAGQFCGRLLADYGAAVTLVEPPGGCAMRRRGPPDPAPGPAISSVAFFHLNHGKQSLVLAGASPEGQVVLRQLIAAADILLVDAGFDRAALAAADPRIIVATISPFGEDGPYAGWRGCEMVFQALSGMMYGNGQAGRKPLFGTGDRASFAAGVGAYITIMAALIARERTGAGQTVRLDVAENTAAMAYPLSLQYFYNGGTGEPRGGRHVPLGKATCRGDWVCYWIQFHRWEAACRALDAPDLAADPRFATHKDRLARWPEVVDEIQARVRDRDADDVVGRWQAERMNAARAYRPSELFHKSPHLQARGFWETLDTPDGPRIIMGPSFRLSATPRHVRGPAPALAGAAAVRAEAMA